MLAAYKSQQPQLARQRLAELYGALVVLPLPHGAGEIHADIRARLEVAGTSIGLNDLWIAAHALAEGWMLVTNNAREFKRVKG